MTKVQKCFFLFIALGTFVRTIDVHFDNELWMIRHLANFYADILSYIKQESFGITNLTDIEMSMCRINTFHDWIIIKLNTCIVTIHSIDQSGYIGLKKYSAEILPVKWNIQMWFCFVVGSSKFKFKTWYINLYDCTKNPAFPSQKSQKGIF